MSFSLPVDAIRDDFSAALEQGHVVVSAATGSGKSTRLPLWAREAGRVLVVEPRRVACTALASFVASQRNQSVGEEIGYAIRFDSRYGPETGVVFVTPGIALRWLAEGRLADFSTVVLDEFHERRWDTDLLLGLLRHRDAHRLVVTSATLAAEGLSRHLAAAHLEAEGRQFPVSVSYLGDDVRDMPARQGLEERLRPAVERALSDTDGDVLVFLPGKGEIESARGSLQGISATVIPLHAGIPAAQQQQALKTTDERRVILATNVAETSLTIPGVTAVVDSGLERRTARRNNRTVLQLSAIAEANAEQRRGRAGRVAPGQCLRLWGRMAPLDSFRPPEVQREDLTEMMLAAACAGVPLEQLEFPDPLPAKSLALARERLLAMGAIDGDGLATRHGRALFALPIDTHFAHLITAMPDEATRAAMVDLTAALVTRPALFRLPEDAHERRALQDWQPVACDALTLIAVLRDEPPAPLSVNRRARDEARRLTGQMREILGLPKQPAPGIDFDRQRMLEAAIRAVPGLAYVRRKRRPQAMGNDRDEVQVGEQSRMEPEQQAAVVFDDHSMPGRRGTRQTLTVGTCLAPVPLVMLDRLGLGRVELGAVRWSEGRPVVIEERHYANRVIASRAAEPTGEALREALAELILDGRLLAPAGERLEADIRQWGLYVAMGEGEGEVPGPREWLTARLRELGVETAADFELIEADDLRFEGVPEWEREAFDRRYPSRFFLGDQHLAVTYDVRRRLITLEPLEGTRKTVPKRWELPSWSGWRVRYRQGSKVVEVK